MVRVPDGMVKRFVEDYETPLKLWREHLGRDLDEIAYLVSIPRTALILYEEGTCRPSAELLAQIALVLGIDVDCLDFYQDEGDV